MAEIKQNMAGNKEAFCRSFDWDIDIKWMDLSGYVRIDDDRRARIQLATHGTMGEYRAFIVSIISKRKGKIEAKSFLFDDYLSDRSDNRSDYPLGKNPCFMVIDHIGWRWYIAVPKTTRPLCQEIEKYIEIFR